MTGDIEAIVRQAVDEVLKELTRRGAVLPGPQAPPAAPTGSQRIDMHLYKTPLLTENALARLHELTGTVIVPAATVVTPRAKEVLRQKNISIVYE